MNIITMYEQGYIDLKEFVENFPDSISESQECIFGISCIKFYVDKVLGNNSFSFYINPY